MMINWRFINRLNRIISYGIGAVLFLLAAIYFYFWYVLQMENLYGFVSLLFMAASIISFFPEKQRTLLILRDVLIACASLILNNVLLGLIICTASIIRVLVWDPPS
jgi:hypothetical protein